MRDCGSCSACCTWLIGDAYGHPFGGGKSCKFLCESGCSVHKARPKVCEKYFCAWAQELIDEDLRPDKCGALVSVENNENGQYLKVLEIGDKEINKNIIDYFNDWSEKMNTPVIFVKPQRES
jgi:Fe-S-cluster containining protein